MSRVEGGGAIVPSAPVDQPPLFSDITWLTVFCRARACRRLQAVQWWSVVGETPSLDTRPAVQLPVLLQSPATTTQPINSVIIVTQISPFRSTSTRNLYEVLTFPRPECNGLITKSNTPAFKFIPQTDPEVVGGRWRGSGGGAIDGNSGGGKAPPPPRRRLNTFSYLTVNFACNLAHKIVNMQKSRAACCTYRRQWKMHPSLLPHPSALFNSSIALPINRPTQ